MGTKRKSAGTLCKLSMEVDDNDDNQLFYELASDCEDSDYDPVKKPSSKKKKKSLKKQIAGIKRKRTEEEPEPEPAPFPFMSLPPELRNQIYKLCLTDGDELAFGSRKKNSRRTLIRMLPSVRAETAETSQSNGRDDPSDDEKPDDGSTPKLPSQLTPLIPQILAVSKQINAEALLILYGQHFILADARTFHTFLTCIGQTGRQVLSNLTVQNWCHWSHRGNSMDNLAVYSLLTTCPSLRRLHLGGSVGYGRQPERLAGHIYRQGHFFFEAYGAANGKKDAVTDILTFDGTMFAAHDYDYWRSKPRKPPQDVQRTKQRFYAELSRLIERRAR